ncbi:ribonuclease pancreatic-like [Arvicanthis niloticus]|uniref:ribonuclease pancreatic-like n=1 Tax=Arvicanthis niloticus TaxID=61156 RepID=UPI0014862C8C|nr:ribonuclease pancreatic-like [Arvicanthis niloticus]XP_034354328.1 ribonuclease pancreatic-like [Arvicanthis niloticus]
MGLEKFLILFPLFVLVLGWVQPSLGQESKAEKFKRQHVDPEGSSNRSPTYCNEMMRRRKIPCKNKNTFIHESLEDVQAVCSQEKVTCKKPMMNNCYKSRATMHITDCDLQKNPKFTNCNYKTRRFQKHIIVACEGNPSVPVHFDGSV